MEEGAAHIVAPVGQSLCQPKEVIYEDVIYGEDEATFWGISMAEADPEKAVGYISL